MLIASLKVMCGICIIVSRNKDHLWFQQLNRYDIALLGGSPRWLTPTFMKSFLTLSLELRVCPHYLLYTNINIHIQNNIYSKPSRSSPLNMTNRSQQQSRHNHSQTTVANFISIRDVFSPISSLSASLSHNEI